MSNRETSTRPPPSQKLTDESDAPSELSSSDPLDRLDSILENEDFAGERISYVTVEAAPEKRNSQFDALRKRYPKAFAAVVMAIAGVAWVKALYEAWEMLK